jgi:hypothetical protein
VFLGAESSIIRKVGKHRDFGPDTSPFVHNAGHPETMPCNTGAGDE